MCGRFTLTLDPDQIREVMQLGLFPPQWIPRYNIAPSQPVAVVTDPASRAVEFLRWGLVPAWAKDIAIGNRLINARAETLNEKPSFRNALKKRRCLILADGFYEWAKLKPSRGTSIPYYFQRKDSQPFAFAGLWEIWHSPEGDVLRTCTIITTEANAVVAEVHDRMPVMLDASTAWKWMGDAPVENLLGYLKPYPADQMKAYAVKRNVNDPKIDDQSLITPFN